MVTPAILIWLFRSRAVRYRAARTWLMTSTFIGLIGFTLLPTCPPRLLDAGHGFVDTMAQYSSYGWWGGEASAPRGLGGMTNQYAAMPSLHVGWALWCGVMLWRHGGTRTAKAAGVVYPLVTTIVVMGTANHYFLDAVAGAAVMAAGLLLTPFVLRAAARVRTRLPARFAPAAAGSANAAVPAPAPARDGAGSVNVSGGCQTSAGERFPRQREQRFGPDPSRTPPPRTRGTRLRHRLAELRGPDVPAKALDARALAALAANPGCRRRAILDGAGVDKASLASALGSPSVFGQSQFAFTRGNAFEARVKADGGAELLRLVHERLDRGAEPPPRLRCGCPTCPRPALRGARRGRRWRCARPPARPARGLCSTIRCSPWRSPVPPPSWNRTPWWCIRTALGRSSRSSPSPCWTAPPIRRRSAPPRGEAAVYVLALERVAARLDPAPRVRHRVLLVCPRDFSNLPTASAVDVRKQRAVTDRQLARLTRIEEIADALPEGVCFSPSCRPRS